MSTEIKHDEFVGTLFVYPASITKALADRLGSAQFVESLKEVVSEAAFKAGADHASRVERTDLTTYTADMASPDSTMQRFLTYEIVENTEKAFELNVTECLHATTWRACDAAELGYAMWCHSDFSNCQGFNPKIHMLRTKTLMQGDDCCNHRWVIEE